MQRRQYVVFTNGKPVGAHPVQAVDRVRNSTSASSVHSYLGYAALGGDQLQVALLPLFPTQCLFTIRIVGFPGIPQEGHRSRWDTP